MPLLRTDPPPFSSLLPAKTVAAAFAVTFLVTAVFEGALISPEVTVFAAGVWFIPAACAVVAVVAAALQKWTAVFGALAAAATIEVLGALAITLPFAGADPLFLGIASVFALLSVAVVAAAALPLVITAGVVGGRRDLEAGDAMLAAGGVWLFIVQLLGMAIASEHALSFVPGVVIAIVAIAVRVARGMARHSWVKRAARGQVDGWSVRTDVTHEETVLLPALFTAPPHAFVGVLERVAVGGGVYRDAILREAVACVRLHEAPRP